MESNPYAPPKAAVADVESSTHGLKRRSVWMMILLCIVTLGVYYIVWFFRRRNGLNRLDSSRKLPMWPLWITAAFYASQFVLGLVSGDRPVEDVLGPVWSGVMTILQLFIGITMIVQSFWIRDIIQDHATPPPDPDERFASHVQLSGLMTFFFSIFYLQWAINKYVVAK